MYILPGISTAFVAEAKKIDSATQLYGLDSPSFLPMGWVKTAASTCFSHSWD